MAGLGWVVTIGGQKGGSGKSTVAQGLAVEAVRQGALVILGDMDQTQQTSLRWAERRRGSGIQPAIDTRILRVVGGVEKLMRLCDLLVVDTPSRADIMTLNLAKISDLLVVTTDTNAFELEPTVMFMQALDTAGIDPGRAAIALTKVLDAKRENDARAYLNQAGYGALPVSLHFSRACHDLGNEGRAVTEAAQPRIAEQAQHFFAGIADALERTRELGRPRIQERDQERGERER